MFKKASFILICFIGIMTFHVFATDTSGYQSPVEKVFVHENDAFKHTQKQFQFADQGFFFIRSLAFKEGKGTYQTSFYIPGHQGTLTYFDANKKTITQALKEGDLPQKSMLFLSTESYHMLLGQPYAYKDLGSGTLEDQVQLKHQIKLKKVQDKWLVTYVIEKQDQTQGIMWGVGSQHQLIALDNEVHLKQWASYDLDLKARLLMDGYYYKSPSSYTPSSPTSFWRSPSMYLANALVKSDESHGGQLLANAMLLLAKDNLLPQGYYPTLPESGWLKEDYQISGGFFDTRFNADAGLTHLLAYQRFGNPLYKDRYTKQATYYHNHIKSNHYKIEKQGQEGWLVYDYTGPGGSETLVALNHQLQAIKWFLSVYLQENDPQYLNTAFKMIKGITLIRDQWIKEDGNLHYAYLPDGTMGLVDYPTLTYNDLIGVQKLLVKTTGEINGDLETLVITKRKWMDAKGIKGYDLY